MAKGIFHLNGEYIDRGATNRTGTYTGQMFTLIVSGLNRDDSIMSAKGLTRNFFDLRAGNSAMKSSAIFYNFGLSCW
ncbi:MAG: hypothetical protein WKF59_23195 [Chitinophagaceae bacterium]